METASAVVSQRKQSSHVRFNEDEFARIEEDSANTGKSIPTLLKEKYFGGPRPLPLISKEDLKRHFGELGRIGNNMNQLARRLNSGIREGFVEELREIQRLFDQHWGFLSGKYCRCDKSKWA